MKLNTQWRLVRQDDNGNIFVIDVYVDKHKAQAAQKHFEGKGPQAGLLG